MANNIADRLLDRRPVSRLSLSLHHVAGTFAFPRLGSRYRHADEQPLMAAIKRQMHLIPLCFVASTGIAVEDSSTSMMYISFLLSAGIAIGLFRQLSDLLR
ncbi:hypothetical protein HHJ39_00080 [Escherichia coli]|nr:hypothetical protein HHJ39_00080 [Escherichia coli]